MYGWVDRRLMDEEINVQMKGCFYQWSNDESICKELTLSVSMSTIVSWPDVYFSIVHPGFRQMKDLAAEPTSAVMTGPNVGCY